jgi:hypothetical protein
MKRIIFRALPILLLLILTIGIIVTTGTIVSCEYTAGIFYTIENSRKIEDLGLPNEVTVGGLKEDSGGIVYAAIGTLYKKTTVTDDWVAVSLPAGFTNTTSIANLGGTLYCVLFNAVTDSALYSYNGTAWNAVSDVQWTGKDIAAVFDTNGNIDLYVLVHNGDATYAIYHSIDGSNFNAVAGLDGIASPVTDVDYNGIDYYAIFGNTLAYSNGNGAEQIDTTIDLTAFEHSGKDFGGIFCDGAETYISTDDGFVFLDSGGWVKSSTTLLNLAEDPARLMDFGKVQIDGTTSLIILGSEDGYFEQTTGAAFTEPTVVTKSENYINLELRSATSLIISQPPSLAASFDFFIGTVGYGLWKNSDSDGIRRWDRE